MVHVTAFVALVLEETQGCVEIQPLYTLEPTEGVTIC
jgi:hypothetical protein